MKYGGIFSVTSKSAITPSLSGRMAMMLPASGRAYAWLVTDARTEWSAWWIRDDRGLVEHDALPAHVHQRVRGPEIDGQIVGEHAANRL